MSNYLDEDCPTCDPNDESFVAKVILYADGLCKCLNCQTIFELDDSFDEQEEPRTKPKRSKEDLEDGFERS